MFQRCAITVLTLGCLMSSAAALPQSAAPADEDMQATIDGMRDASTWGHPDQFGQYKGLADFADGDFAAAMRMFKVGAFYADKVSQISLGLMYLNGQGTTADPVQAWAWVALSAERGYPAFVETRDRIWSGLDAGQRKRAEAIRDKLAETYADVHAKKRMIGELNYYRSQLTGSHTGFDSGAYHMAPSGGHSGLGNAGCGRAARVGLRGAGCGGDLYAAWQWDPKIYFKTRDAQYMGTVTVGKLEAAPDKSPGQPSGK
jgi:hypothetical protein